MYIFFFLYLHYLWSFHCCSLYTASVSQDIKSVTNRDRVIVSSTYNIRVPHTLRSWDRLRVLWLAVGKVFWSLIGPPLVLILGLGTGTVIIFCVWTFCTGNTLFYWPANYTFYGLNWPVGEVPGRVWAAKMYPIVFIFAFFAINDITEIFCAI